MSPDFAVLVAFALALIASFLLVGLVRRYAIKAQMIDIPGARSSHGVATPRGGGLAIVIIYAMSLVLLWYMGLISAPIVGIMAAGSAVAIVGWLDDRADLSPWTRLIVQALAATYVVYLIGDGIGEVFSVEAPLLKGLFRIGSVIFLVWCTNLFNFMDGIDGIASAQAGYMCIAVILLAYIGEGVTADMLSVAVLAGASIGFLRWNWSPAKIFMGDVGSGFLGFVLAGQAMYFASQGSISIYIWILISGVFLVDATYTISRRLLRGERLFEAHRIHAYQWLARKWQSHSKVSLVYLAINCFWLFPIAIIAQQRPGSMLALLVVGTLPLIFLAGICGAGKNEST